MRCLKCTLLMSADNDQKCQQKDPSNNLYFHDYLCDNLNYKQIQMLNQQKKDIEEGCSLITEQNVRQSHKPPSQSLAIEIINTIIIAAQQQIKQNKFISKFLLPYSQMKAQNSFNQINNMFLDVFAWSDHEYVQEKEPCPLQIDSLLPISADIDLENIYKRNNLYRKSINQSIEPKNRLRQVQIKPKEGQVYTKLGFTQISEEDGFTKELRKVEEENTKKKEAERYEYIKKEQLKNQKLKDNKGTKEQKLSYDYNGDVIPIKQQNKVNLVSKVISAQTNANIKINKEINRNPKPSEVQGNRPGKMDSFGKKLAGLAVLKKRDEVQFSEVKSLADNIKTSMGVKYTYEGKTFEQKKKVITNNQLKKSVSQNKLSKQDYKRLRELNENKIDRQEKMKQIVKEDTETKRTFSEVKPIQSRTTNRKKETIRINNNNLKQKLLQKLGQPEYLLEDIQHNEEEKQSIQANKLGTIDNFNLQYMRTGGTLQTSTSKQFYTQRSKNQLPKISHTTLYNKMLPKGRQRIKGANQIIRDLRKKFQEKLRV